MFMRKIKEQAKQIMDEFMEALEKVKDIPEEFGIEREPNMREVKEKTSGIHQQIKGLKAEIKNILTAPEFNDALFLEKMKSIQELHITMKEVRNEAIVKLAKQFTQEEREILAELIPQKHRHRGGRGSAR